MILAIYLPQYPPNYPRTCPDKKHIQKKYYYLKTFQWFCGDKFHQLKFYWAELQSMRRQLKRTCIDCFDVVKAPAYS